MQVWSVKPFSESGIDGGQQLPSLIRPALLLPQALKLSDRLVTVKTTVDPTNLLRLNQNIKPKSRELSTQLWCGHQRWVTLTIVGRQRACSGGDHIDFQVAAEDFLKSGKVLLYTPDFDVAILRGVHM